MLAGRFEQMQHYYVRSALLVQQDLIHGVLNSGTRPVALRDFNQKNCRKKTRFQQVTTGGACEAAWAVG